MHWWDVAGGVSAGIGIFSTVAWKPFTHWLDQRIERRFKALSFPQVKALGELRTDMTDLAQAFYQHADRDELTRRHLAETLERMERGQGVVVQKLDSTHDLVLTLQERVENETEHIRREQGRVAKNLQSLQDARQTPAKS
jgi:hypothetical protein